MSNENDVARSRGKCRIRARVSMPCSLSTLRTSTHLQYAAFIHVNKFQILSLLNYTCGLYDEMDTQIELKRRKKNAAPVQQQNTIQRSSTTKQFCCFFFWLNLADGNMFIVHLLYVCKRCASLVNIFHTVMCKFMLIRYCYKYLISK